MKIQEFYDKNTGTFSYVVSDCASKKAAVIDSVLDYDQFSGAVGFLSVSKIIDYIELEKLDLEWILETHIHADHLSAAAYLKKKFPQVKTAISDKISEVAKYWGDVFEIDAVCKFDKVFGDGEVFKIGDLEVLTIQAPGHTPSCICYKIDDVIFVGDVIFMPDIGTARCDFAGGSALDSWESLQKILALDDKTKIYTGHDYAPKSREISCVSTVLEQKENNIMVGKNATCEEFVAKRNARDAKLSAPKLLYPALQVNICGGELPEKYIKIPLKL